MSFENNFLPKKEENEDGELTLGGQGFREVEGKVPRFDEGSAREKINQEIDAIGELRKELLLDSVLHRPEDRSCTDDPDKETIRIGNEVFQVMYVDRKVLGNAFGRAYPSTGVAYVREDLPPRVKRFVRAHELYHLQDGRYDHWILREIRANLIPGIRDPLGLLATIGMTLGSKDRLKFYWQRFRNGQ